MLWLASCQLKGQQVAADDRDGADSSVNPVWSCVAVEISMDQLQVLTPYRCRCGHCKRLIPAFGVNTDTKSGKHGPSFLDLLSHNAVFDLVH